MVNLIFGVVPGRYKNKDVDVSQVAIWNEYGTEKIPPRPAFRRGLEHALKINKKLISGQMKNITNRLLTGRRVGIEQNLTVLLTQIGKSAKAETRRIIKEGDETPNAPSTTEKKGFNHPLYEGGVLLEHVDYEVTKK